MFSPGRREHGARGQGVPNSTTFIPDVLVFPDRMRTFFDGFVSPFMNCVQPPLQSCCAVHTPPVGLSPPGAAAHPSSWELQQQQESPVSPIYYSGESTSGGGTNVPISKPHENDILCGRGWSKNPANRKYRDLIIANKAAYDDCRGLTKKQKVMVARQIVDLIRYRQNPPGRFLARNAKTGMWSDIGMSRSIEKTSQALRDNNNNNGSSSNSCCSNSEATASCCSSKDHSSTSGGISHSSSHSQSHSNSSSKSSSGGGSRDAVKVPPIIIPPHLKSSFQNKNTATAHTSSPSSSAPNNNNQTKFDWMYDIPSSYSPPSHHTTTTTHSSQQQQQQQRYIFSPPPTIPEPRHHRYPLRHRRCQNDGVGPTRHDRMAVVSTSPAGCGAPPPNHWRDHPLWRHQHDQQWQQHQSKSSGHDARTMPTSFYMPTLALPPTKAGAPAAAPSAHNTARRTISRRKRSDSDSTPPRSNRAAEDSSSCHEYNGPVPPQPTPITTRRTAARVVSPEHQSTADWKRARRVLGGWEEEEWEKDDSLYLSSTEGDEGEDRLRGSSISAGTRSTSLSEAIQSNLVLEDRIVKEEEGLQPPNSTRGPRQQLRRHGSGEEVDGQTALSVAAFLRLDESD